MPTDPTQLFGIEIARSQIEANEVPPEQSARETLAQHILAEDVEAISELTKAVNEVSKVVTVTQETEDGTLELTDIFTAGQIQDMSQRIHDYLGTDLETHLSELRAAPGYPFYVSRLAMYFSASNDDVTQAFGAFEDKHTYPASPRATGPRENNSREYANFANDELLRQFATFYQAQFDIRLVGPTKVVEGSRVSWQRGIAECQFLVLDYMRDQLISGPRVATQNREAMTQEDIESNLLTLIRNKRQIVAEASSVHQLLAKQLSFRLDELGGLTVNVMHRGRSGVPRFKREPARARAAINEIESLMLQAVAMAETRIDQEDIPVLDI